MKVLDASFLIDYLDAVESATDYLDAHRDERFILPLPAYAEAVVGEGNLPGESDLAGIQSALAWGEVYDVAHRHVVIGAEIADDIGPQGPYLGGCDALIAAVGRELDATVVSSDRDLTHPETKQVLDVEEYKEQS